MIVYHGTTEIIKKPDVSYSKKYFDFGRGFYLTTYEEQAKKWAIRKGMRQEKAPIVNVYELNEQWEKYRVLSFEKENDIIMAISEIKEIELRRAFDIYYSSKLAGQIADSSYGIENMDAKYLAEDLIENEPELFE